MSYSYGRKTTHENPEVEVIVKAVEDRLEDAVNQYKSAADELGIRLKDLEQSVVGGYHGGSGGGIESKAQPLQRAVQSENVKSFFDRQVKQAQTQFDVGALLTKNTILGESGSPQNPDDTLVQGQRIGTVSGAYRTLELLDFLTVVNTNSNRIEYTRESAFSNDAAETSEGGQKPESDLTFELVEENVRTIAHFLKVSRQAWDDSPWLQTYLFDRLTHAVRARLQSQLIGGNGTSPNIAGITSSGRHTAFSPETGETALDSLNRCKYAIEAADYNADFVLMNPATWGSIERQRRASGDDAFTLGEGGAASFVAAGMAPTVWSVPVITTNDVASGKFIMGSRDAMRLVVRQEAEFRAFEEDSDNVQKNLITLRAELRAALAVLVPTAVRYGDLVA
jgi:HK97 family phage major capsid protein